jgi:hypothetical protein
MINERGDLRQLVSSMVRDGGAGFSSEFHEPPSRPKVLLMDEVDVFFKSDFYGQLYNLIASIRDAAIPALCDYIWETRTETAPSLDRVQRSPHYRACAALCRGWEQLDEAVKDMLVHVREFNVPQYCVVDRKIAYKEQDGMSDEITYGYRTLFAYYHECAEGTISEETRDRYASINIRCGSFSYAEMPKYFQVILGVTGTLEHLSGPEKGILTNDSVRVRKEQQ